jgi:hypothetical protein
MNSLSLVKGIGYADYHPDINITRRHDCWIYKSACENLEPRIFDLSARSLGEIIVDGEAVWSDVQWIACFPLSLPIGGERRMRRAAIVVDSNVPINFSLVGASEFLDDFLVRAFAHVADYDQKHDLMESLQGENTWL